MADRRPLLVGDLGGTKTRLALYAGGRGRTPGARGRSTPRHRQTPVRLAEAATFPSGSYETLESIVREYLRRTGARPDRAVLGVAGPVVRGRAEITNLPWQLTESGLRRALRLRSVRLLNDLLAIARAVPVLGPRDTLTINRGAAERRGAIAMIAPGTGLGQAFLVWDGQRYRAYASEGGHADFAPPSPLATELLTFLRRTEDHVSAERVCAGVGIPRLYAFLRARGDAAEPAWFAEQVAAADDPVPVIIQAALDQARPCPIAVAVLDLFVDILGAEAGNLALKVLATGGVYLAGGIPPRIADALRDGRFMRAFTRKGRLSELLTRVPVRLVVHPQPALVGAVCAAQDAAG